MYNNRLKDLREDKDLFQKDIANFLNMKQQQYSRYETGIIDIPVKYLIKLAKFYDVSLDYISGISNIKKTFPKN